MSSLGSSSAAPQPIGTPQAVNQPLGSTMVRPPMEVKDRVMENMKKEAQKSVDLTNRMKREFKDKPEDYMTLEEGIRDLRCEDSLVKARNARIRAEMNMRQFYPAGHQYWRPFAVPLSQDLDRIINPLQ